MNFLKKKPSNPLFHNILKYFLSNQHSVLCRCNIDQFVTVQVSLNSNNQPVPAPAILIKIKPDQTYCTKHTQKMYGIHFFVECSFIHENYLLIFFCLSNILHSRRFSLKTKLTKKNKFPQCQMRDVLIKFYFAILLVYSLHYFNEIRGKILLDSVGLSTIAI